MTNDNYKVIMDTSVILQRGDQIFLMRRFNTGYEDGKYGLIGGHGEEHEDPREAIIREALEEAGIILVKDDLEMVHVAHRKGPGIDRISFIFKAKSWENEPAIMETDKCDAMGWFDLHRLPDNIVEFMRRGIEAYKDGVMYLEMDLN